MKTSADIGLKDLLSSVRACMPVLWCNKAILLEGLDQVSDLVAAADVDQAVKNWQRLAPALATCFPELESTGGVIESSLLPVPRFQKAMGCDAAEFGRFFIKADHDLPVAGSVKARGGIYEVFMHAEAVAHAHAIQDLNSQAARDLFAMRTIAVGSTGNLGLSIGLAARALGFKAVVHMSMDAKSWKIDRLRAIGADVVQHPADYATAVDIARQQAAEDKNIYFVDDERSKLLFLGYSAAASRLKAQLDAQGIQVDADHPLFVYLPCGIGGAPGGVAFGLKVLFGAHVHCFFAEPVQSPCALVQLAKGIDRPVSVYDLGLENKTEADGLAVGLMSQFVAKVMAPLLSGVFTVRDDDLFRDLYRLEQTEGHRVEPSAAASFTGPDMLMHTSAGQTYLKAHGIADRMSQASHILWTTGGRLVPDDQYQGFRQRGREQANAYE